MNKKGVIFIIIFTFLAISLFGFIWYVSLVKEPSSRNYMKAGDVAVDILNSKERARAQLFFTEKIAGYAARDSLIDLAKDSGCIDWGDKNCKLIENLDKVYLDYFKTNFKKYMDKLGYGSDYDINLKRENNKFILKFNADKLDFTSPAKVSFSYVISHSFDKEMNYNLNIYNELYSKYHEHRKSCSEYDLKDNIKCDDSSDKIYIKFEVTTKELFVNPVIKFKVTKIGPLEISNQ